jgi:hypothetical protein
MVNMPQKMKNRDIRRAVSAVKSAGLAIDTIDLDPATGKIKITTIKPGAPSANNEWDEALGHEQGQA